MDITELLASKSFEELTRTEQAFAISELGSASAYREMYEVVQGISNLDGPKVTSTGRHKTMEAFDTFHSEEPTKRRGVIWLKPLIAGLAAASIIAFVWFVGFSDLNKNETLAERKPEAKQELNDSTNANEAVDNEMEEETEKPEEAPAASSPTSEQISEDTDNSNNAPQPNREAKALIAEEATAREAYETTIDISSAEVIENESKSNTDIELDDEETVRNSAYNKTNSDSDISTKERVETEAPVMLESISMRKSGKKNSAESQINMNSNIAKPAIFKVNLPLRIHYTAY